jgi:hypothetical protein
MIIKMSLNTNNSIVEIIRLCPSLDLILSVRAKFPQVYLTRCYRNGRTRSIATCVNGKPKDEGGEI